MLVAVEFSKNANKLYACRIDAFLAKKVLYDDWVVVMSGQYKVVKVKALIFNPSEEQLRVTTRFIVDIVDVNAYRKRVKDATP